MKINKNKIIPILLSLLLPAFILINQPLKMNINQSIIISSLVLILIWWTTNMVNRSFASIFLLIIFLFFGDTPPRIIFRFALSSDFYLIILSFLLSQGIVNSNIANRFSNFFLNKYGNTGVKLVRMSFFLGFLLMFIIPQPFSRVILLASIYSKFLEDKDIDNKTKQILILSIFVASTAVSMFVLNGDIILNYSIFQAANTSMSSNQWIRYMSLPTLFTTILIYVSYVLTWRKNLKNVDFSKNEIENLGKLTKNEKIVAVLMLSVAILWMTEGFHGINSAIIALIATIIMFGYKIIDKKDLNSVNLNLMIFLIAAFSIGGVMSSSGVANKLYSQLLNILNFSDNYNIFIFTIILITMILHMILGSSVTAISIVSPGLIELTGGRINVHVLMFLIYITVNIHYILPFHQATIMVGSGKYYDSKLILKFGIVSTFIVFIAVFLFYLPWWKFIEVLI